LLSIVIDLTLASEEQHLIAGELLFSYRDGLFDLEGFAVEFEA